MARIGVFWIYKETVLGKSAGLSEGHENVPGIVDSPYDHVECWEHDASFIQPFPELRGSEYQSVPRGRVLFDTKTNSPIVYHGRELLNDRSRALIAEFFDFESSSASWRIDPHYATSQEEIDSLFGDLDG